MEFGLLGPLEIRGGAIPLGRRKERALLALLLLNANRVVPRERLIDELWGEEPADHVVKRLQVYVSQLRKLLPQLALRTRQPGYLLEVEPDAVDALRFERLVAAARAVEPARATTLLQEALALWRGPALAEFDESFARVEAARLEELRLVALEERVEADLALGRDAELVAGLEALVAEHPHRERLRGQLMLALYRSGRQAEALEAYRDARAALDELGLDPGAALRQLEQRILTQDSSLERGRAALPGALVPVPAFPFVGRAAELATLRSALDRAEQGEGGLVLLGAEAGGGKTRLVRELAVEAAERGVLVLYGVSDAVVSTPYQPLREWLSFLARSLEPDVLEVCLGERRELVARLAPELAREPAGPDVDRYAIQSAVCEVLRQVSRVQPVVLVAEDVHWADAETLSLLRRLAATAPEARMLVLATYRDRGEEHPPSFTETLAELTRVDGVTRIAPARLTTDEVRGFIGASTDAEATGELAGAVAELTGGTPLLVCELWRDLRESGAVEVSNTGVQLLHPLAELRGPERLRDVVRHRLSRLAPETAATLELAAVGGPRFELRALAYAAGREQTAVAVEEATSQGLLEELPETVPAYRFTHELVRRAVYDRITGVRRAELHLRFGEALEHTHATDPTPVLPELAHHFTLAVAVAGTGRAVDYNLRAASAAVAASAFEEGAARLSAALELGVDDPRERARVQLELGYLLHQLGRGPEADARLTDSLAAATGADERGVAAHALVQRWFQRFADPRLDLDEMCLALEGAIRTFEELGDHRGLAIARRNLSIATSRAGRGWGPALELLERALIDANASGDPNTRRTVIGTLLNTLTMGSATPVAVGIARCEELLRSSGDDAVLDATIRRFLSLLLAMAGRVEEAREEVRRSSLVLDGLSHLTSSWVYGPVVAQTRALIDDRAGAERELIATIESFQALGDAAIDERAINAAGLLAQLYCDEGRWDEAATWLAFGEGIPLAHSTGTARRRLAAQARLAAHRGEHAEALALARSALDGATFSVVAWSALAEVHRTAGATAEADAALAEAIRLHEAKGNVAAARQLLARLT